MSMGTKVTKSEWWGIYSKEDALWSNGPTRRAHIYTSREAARQAAKHLRFSQKEPAIVRRITIKIA